MSDPTASPAKPKVGSLRDRIAAFEKPAAAGNAPPSAPAPRPKPGGVSWKPKVPSPPSSPGSTEHAASERKTGGMSASDAKESIGKGGSLKDRMAALQGKGAFGAPPPVAPKPVVEKPKWKPPPVVAPIDKDEGAEHPPSESSSSIPVPVVVPPVRLPEDESATEAHEEVTPSVAEGEEQAEADPQEEERQRRAAIAARMARLGGARVGMAPMFGRPPVAKKPESLHVADDTPVASTVDNVSQEQTAETTAVAAAAGSSESLSLPSGDPEQQGSRSPNSMPLPSAPRRAGPPRKKPSKSPTPPTADLEVPPTETHDILSTADTPAITKKDKVEWEKAGETTEAASEIPETRNEERVAEEADIPVEDDSQISDIEDEKSVDVVAPSHAPNVSHGAEDDEDEAAYKVQAEVEHERSSEAVDQDAKELVEQPADELEDEETARRKRVAEKFVKMGGINPLYMPVQPKPSADETQFSPPVSPLTKRASLSMQSATTPSPVQRAQSLRKSSVDSTVALQESPPVPQRKSSVDETPISVPVSPMLARQASLSRKSTDSLQRKQSLRKSVDSTAVLEEEAPSRSSAISPPSRKSSVDPTVSGSVSDSISKRDSQDVAVHIGQVAATRLPEGSEPIGNVERVRGKPTAYSEEFKSVRGKHEVKTHDAADDSLEVVDLDNEPTTSAPLIIPTPPAPKWTTRPQVAPVESPLVEPIPIPPRTLQQAPPVAAPPPTRSIPLPPPFLVPQYDDESAGRSDREDNEEPQQASDDEGSPLPRRIPPRLVSNDDNTDSESAPLPVPTRRPTGAQGRGSPTPSLTASSRPARRSLPPPPPPSSAPASDVEHDSDLDEILPTPPRHRPSTPGMPPSNEVPLIVPPPHAEDLSRKVAEPSPLRHSYPSPIYAFSDSGSSYDGDQSPSHLSDSLPVSEQEILDEEEGDPIDPNFHSPSRSGSTLNLDAPQHSPGNATLELSEQGQAADVAKRATIAERMAKLGGLQFGAAPVPPSFSRPPPPPRPDDDSVAQSVDAPAHEEPVEVDEEEERTRKERIAAKLAGMGGMRIGMMPLGPGALRPQQSHVLKEDNETPVPAATAPPRAPPSRRPPSQTESDDGMSASHHSLSTSEEGVKVEAEESEMEEVSYEDAEDEAPPPVPTRPTRRSTSEIEPTKAATAPTPRPPVPTSVLARRSSVQTTTSGRKSSVDSSPGRSATVRHQSDYVMVEEPKGLVAEEVPPPPARPLARTSSTRETPSRRPPYTSDISSQWELPAIPSSSLGFSGSTDLSLSWSDAGAPDSLPPSTTEKSHPQALQGVSPDQPLPSDYLIAVWGRVGVQVCEVATSLFEKSKKTLIGDGTYRGFVTAVVNEVPNASLPAPPSYGHVIYVQNGSAVQKRVNEIMPGDIVELQDAKFKGHKGIQMYSQHVGVGEPLVGVVSEFEPKKSKIRLFQANQHVGQQTVEAVSYRLEDLKSGTLKAYRVLEA